MIRTKNIIQSIHEVPDTWVFEYYAPIPKLTGQRVSILSIFNATDTNPSLVFYTKGGEYLFKDFSEGLQGDKVDFYRYYVQYKMGKTITNAEAIVALIYTYSEWLLNNNYRKVDIVDEAKFKVESFELRSWYQYDAKYFFNDYRIPSRVLDYFIVKPLNSLIVSNGIKTYNIKKGMTYGYFKKDGTLYKTYAPLESKDKKFNNYQYYIQGWEQLRLDGRTLVIVSSLKDGMVVFTMYPNVDIVAPPSENSYLTMADIEFLKKHYSKIYILFDYDEAGNKAFLVYKNRFGLTDQIIVPLSKDVSDSVRDHSPEKVKPYLDPYLL
jgi:hypothetical protein